MTLINMIDNCLYIPSISIDTLNESTAAAGADSARISDNNNNNKSMIKFNKFLRIWFVKYQNLIISIIVKFKMFQSAVKNVMKKFILGFIDQFCFKIRESFCYVSWHTFEKSRNLKLSSIQIRRLNLFL